MLYETGQSVEVGDAVSVRGQRCRAVFVPQHSEYVIVTNEDGFKFHAFPEMIDGLISRDPFPNMSGREIARCSRMGLKVN